MSAATRSSLPFPLNAARSSGAESHALLAALLATGELDEISDVDDCSGVAGYASGQGRADASGRVQKGLTFWVYPTSLHGPYHETAEGAVEQHGLLLTVERGALVSDVVARVRARVQALTSGGIAHEHIAAV